MTALRFTVCGIGELGAHCRDGVTDLLSILDPAWPLPEILARYRTLRNLELRFHDIIEPLSDRVAPEPADIERLLHFAGALGGEAHLLVHCHAGLSRSTAAMALILARRSPEAPAAAAFDAILRRRPRAWPNLRMLELGDALLGRRGEILEAAAAVYRQAIDREPLLAEMMIADGRGREVASALRLSGRASIQRS